MVAKLWLLPSEVSCSSGRDNTRWSYRAELGSQSIKSNPKDQNQIKDLIVQKLNYFMCSSTQAIVVKYGSVSYSKKKSNFLSVNKVNYKKQQMQLIKNKPVPMNYYTRSPENANGVLLNTARCWKDDHRPPLILPPLTYSVYVSVTGKDHHLP